MCRRRFTDAQIEKRGDDGRVQDIPRVDECFGRGVGELGEARGGLLRGGKGADGVDVEILVEIGEGQRERVIGRVGGRRTAFLTQRQREKKKRAAVSGLGGEAAIYTPL